MLFVQGASGVCGRAVDGLRPSYSSHVRHGERGAPVQGSKTALESTRVSSSFEDHGFVLADQFGNDLHFLTTSASWNIKGAEHEGFSLSQSRGSLQRGLPNQGYRPGRKSAGRRQGKRKGGGPKA